MSSVELMHSVKLKKMKHFVFVKKDGLSSHLIFPKDVSISMNVMHLMDPQECVVLMLNVKIKMVDSNVHVHQVSPAILTDNVLILMNVHDKMHVVKTQYVKTHKDHISVSALKVQLLTLTHLSVALL
jgi:hypothetical protein